MCHCVRVIGRVWGGTQGQLQVHNWWPAQNVFSSPNITQDGAGEETNTGNLPQWPVQWRKQGGRCDAMAVGWLSVPARYRSLPKRLVWTGGAPRQSGLQLRPAGTHTRVPVPPRAPSLLPLLLPPIPPRWNLFLYLLDHSHPVTVTLQGGKGCSWRGCSRGKGFGQSATLGRGGRKGWRVRRVSSRERKNRAIIRRYLPLNLPFRGSEIIGCISPGRRVRCQF